MTELVPSPTNIFQIVARQFAPGGGASPRNRPAIPRRRAWPATNFRSHDSGSYSWDTALASQPVRQCGLYRTYLIAVSLLSMLLSMTSGAVASPPIDNGVQHVVLCWLNEPGNTEHRDKVIETSRELRHIPGVHDLTVGRPLASERPIVDDSFDVGVMMRFTDTSALQAYLEHPDHVNRVHRILQPLCGRILVYDIEY